MAGASGLDNELVASPVAFRMARDAVSLGSNKVAIPESTPMAQQPGVIRGVRRSPQCDRRDDRRAPSDIAFS
jgi:hypothetical protein